MGDLNIFDWMKLTKPNKPGLTPRQRIELNAVRKNVFRKAKTTANALTVAKSRGRIGKELYDAVYGATQLLRQEHLRMTVVFEDYLAQVEREAQIRERMQALEAEVRGNHVDSI